LNQRAEWGRQSGVSHYGQPQRTATTIDCRIEKRIRLTQDQAGRDVTSTMTVYIAPQEGIGGCEDLIGDTINGMPILQAAEMTDANGEIIGYEVML
jgi:hypothetical protein